MRTLLLVKGSICCLLVAALAGCGGGETPPAKAPEAKEAAPKTEPPKSDEAKDEEAADAKGDAKKTKVGEKSPKDVIGDPELAFMFSFKDSDMRSKKEEECSKKTKDDLEKKAACMSKAQAEVDSDGIRFLKDDKGDNWYVVFHRQGEKVTELTRLKYTIGKESGNQVTLSLTGKDMGKKPGAVPSPSDLVIEIVDDYTIALNDPNRGKMVYRGKTGLFSDTATTKPSR